MEIDSFGVNPTIEEEIIIFESNTGFKTLVFDDTEINYRRGFNIVKAIKRNDGYCPCNKEVKNKEDNKCPCKEYREDHYCCCNLYLKKIK